MTSRSKGKTSHLNVSVRTCWLFQDAQTTGCSCFIYTSCQKGISLSYRESEMDEENQAGGWRKKYCNCNFGPVIPSNKYFWSLPECVCPQLVIIFPCLSHTFGSKVNTVKLSLYPYQTENFITRVSEFVSFCLSLFLVCLKLLHCLCSSVSPCPAPSGIRKI